MSENQDIDWQIANAIHDNSDEIALRIIAFWDETFPDSGLRDGLPMEERTDWIKLDLERASSLFLGKNIDGTMRTVSYYPRTTELDQAFPWVIADILKVYETESFIEMSILPVLWRLYSADTENLFLAVTRLKALAKLFVKNEIEYFARKAAQQIDKAHCPPAVATELKVSADSDCEIEYGAELLTQRTSLMRQMIVNGCFKEAMVAASEVRHAEMFYLRDAQSLRAARGKSESIPDHLYDARLGRTQAASNAKKENYIPNTTYAQNHTGIHHHLGILTQREVDVADLVACGESNASIAQTLCITENTVKHHLSNIMDKLQVKNRTQVASIVLGNRGGGGAMTCAFRTLSNHYNVLVSSPTLLCQ
jgi:DNA-binding CsgD family transcriptional regulator